MVLTVWGDINRELHVTAMPSAEVGARFLSPVSDQGDVLAFEGMLVGAFSYRGSAAFTGGGDNTEARVSGDAVLVDADGDGAADLTITLTGLTSASQLSDKDFLFS